MKLFSWIPSSFATWVYTVLFKPKFLRIILQRLICIFIPEKIKIEGVTFALNQKDAIVSGSLYLGFYEKSNIKLFSELFGKKSNKKVFIDIGANIGLYSALASKYLQGAGKVIAIEPDEINCNFIRKTIGLNNFSNIDVYQMALGDYDGEAKLYINNLNKADHRLYDNLSERPFKAIKIAKLDTVLNRYETKLNVDFIKIDTQGYEYRVLKGMSNTFRNNPEMKVMMEFWPWGITQAGDNPAELLKLIQDYGFKIKRIDEDNALIHEVENLESILGLVEERQHIDLFLEKN